MPSVGCKLLLLRVRREISPKGKAHSSVYALSGIARCGHCRGPMSGKTGAAYKGKYYRNYYCSNAMHSHDLCAFYNGHSAIKLELAVVDYLGQFTHPALVRQYLEATDREEIEKREPRVKEIEKRLADSESGFLKRLDDLLRRHVITEAEFERVNQAERKQNSKLEVDRDDLKQWLEAAHDRAALVERPPIAIATFLEAFERLDPRQQKAHLQTI